MQIAYAVRRSFPGPGGISTAMRVVATELAREHTVRVWAARIDDQPFTRLNTTLGAQAFDAFWLDHVEVRPLPVGPASLARALPMALMTAPVVRRVAYQWLRKATAGGYVKPLADRLRREWGSPTIVHCWGGEHTNWAAGRAAADGDTPFVVTPFAHPGAWGDDEMNAAFYRSADRVLALVPSEAAFYATLGVEASRVRVVGVPATPLPDDGPDVRARHAIGDDPLVLFLGVKERYKGYGLLLEGAQAIWASHPRARIAFVGPETPASSEDFAATLDQRIIRVGRVGDAEVASWHRAADVFCLPSTSEIMPVSILEAWQAATPVVAARWWCAPDLIDDGEDGRIIDADAQALADAVTALLNDRPAARAMGESGRAKVAARFSPQVVARAHLDAYRELT